MDVLAMDEELLALYNTFHQGQFEKTLEYDARNATKDNSQAVRVLQLRAKIALGKTDEVIEEVATENEPDLVAIGALAHMKKGNHKHALELVASLQETAKGTAILLVGTVLQLAGRSEDALALLLTHQGDLEVILLIVQIYLHQNRTDLAVKEVAAARKWAQDNMLVNLAESWVGLRLGGEKYQQAFYVFEELAQGPSTSSSQSLISQAVSEIHLGRLDEADIALRQVLAKDTNNADAIVNNIVLNSIAGKDTSQLLQTLEVTAPDHLFMQDLTEKTKLFDTAALKYSARVVAT